MRTVSTGQTLVVAANNFDAGSEENTGNVADFGPGGHPVANAEGHVLEVAKYGNVGGYVGRISHDATVGNTACKKLQVTAQRHSNPIHNPQSQKPC